MTIEDQPVGRILFGYWDGEDVVVIRTGEEEWELHCHGGYAAVNRIQASLESKEVQIQDWQNLETQSVTRLEREFQSAITESVTWKTAELLLRHPTSEWITELRRWQTKLIEKTTTELTREIQTRCEQILSMSDFGIRLTTPATIVLAGAPNVGKSSLLNRLAGFDRSIVQNQPGTTRDTVGAEIALEGFPVTLTDTAGLRQTEDRLESAGIIRAQKVLGTADLILFLIDGTTAPSPEEDETRQQYPQALNVLHKSDQAVHFGRKNQQFDLHVSALTGEGVEDLIETIIGRLVPERPDASAIFPVTYRQIDLLKSIVSAIDSNEIEALDRLLENLLTGTSSKD